MDSIREVKLHCDSQLIMFPVTLKVLVKYKKKKRKKTKSTVKVQVSDSHTSMENTQDTSSSDNEHVEIKGKHYKCHKWSPEKKQHGGGEFEKMSMPADE